MLFETTSPNKEVNMKAILLSGLALAAVSMAGCSSKVYTEKAASVNLSSYKTYMWVDTHQQQNDGEGRARPIAYADQNVHDATRAPLEKLGWREVSNNPDVLLSYDILVQRSTAQESSPVYSSPFTRYYYNPWARRWGSVYYPSQFVGYDTYTVPVREGTFTITMIDARSDKTVWQGWTTEEIRNRRPSPAEIRTTVNRIMKKLNKS
jgi:hypothetical protein